MTKQSRAEPARSSRPEWILQRLGMPALAFAVVAGAIAGTVVEVALLVVDVEWQSFMLFAAVGLFVCLLIGVMLALPLWEVLHRYGYRRWWQAAAFGAVLGLVSTMVLVHETSDLALRIDGTITFAAAVTALVVWWIAYRKRG